MEEENIFEKVAVVVLVGGKSSRMNYQDKYNLEVAGKRMLDRTLEAFQDFENIYISINREQGQVDFPYPTIVDEYSEIGPIGGIYSVSEEITDSLFFVVSCDMPFVTKDMVEFLCVHFDPETDDCVLPTVCGKPQPLFGLYTKRIKKILKEDIENNHYKLMKSLEGTKMKLVEFPDSYEKNFTNMNTKEEYEEVLRENLG